MEKYCISVDWLQVCCYGNLLEEGEYKAIGKSYSIVMTDIHTALFCRVLNVEYNGMTVATIEQEPRSSALKKGLTLIKLANRVLWSTGYIAMLYELMKIFNLTYKGITRLDICYDCNHFYDGRNPGRFITDFLLKPVTEVGGTYRRGSSKFTVQGGRSACSNTKVTGIKFGSTANGVVPYIYDKTLELQEVKDKPWIREVWQMNGLVSNEKTHVWRAEISIKSKGNDILNMGTGQLFKISPNYLEHYENIVKLFHYYAAKVFDFRVNTGQACKKHFKKIQIFDDTVRITCKPISLNRSADTGRIEKVCYNKLDKLATTYTDLSEPIRQSLHTAMDFLSHLSGVKLAITRQNAYKRYLDSLKGCAFMTELDFAYFEALDECWKQKSNIDAESLYQNMIMEYDDHLSRQQV